ncbi:MAG: ImmA/IrrE family metallo-endopeptidase [Anaerolineaceae bacterium]
MENKIIKTEEEYKKSLDRLSALMDSKPETPEGEELELLSFLISNYESEHFPISLPDPIEAIKFRMEQQGLTQKDLVQFIGTQSKVSEILNRKRPLSLAMIRNLAKGLEIPAEVLIREPGGAIPEKRYNIEDFPFTEMFNRGYFAQFAGSLTQAKQQAEECLESLFSVFQNQTPEYALCRSSEGEMNRNALAAWQAQVLSIAKKQEIPEFNPGNINPDTIHQIVRLSAYTTGPKKAQELLIKYGIPLVILPHLPHTYLDGACFLDPEGRPVIGMTLRHDRLDNFWFTLIHELAHVYLHLLKGRDVVYFDDTEQATHDDCTPQEKEADGFCSEMLIPHDLWEREKGSLINAVDNNSVIKMAEKLDISPAIIAGRVRYEKKDFSMYTNLVGNGTVRALFEGR